MLQCEKQLSGCIHKAADFLQKEQLTDRALWARFVDQFRDGIDGENNGWRGEYWGKMMRGGVLTWEYTRDDTLYAVLTETVRDMLTVAEADGRVSSYSRETEFDAWDLWCRKYVLLGMEYYLDICRDEALKGQILEFLCRQLDYILRFIGEGKKPITSASRHWLGVNSSSILEPVVRLYRLTQNRAYLDFASYIVASGGAEGVNIFELAYENKLPPYQYGVSKAYEMMSCFEGLLEYALVTDNKKHLTACVNFGKAILQTDITIIGSSGCTHELLDHSAARQTARSTTVMQETCVTVTWMKLCSRLLALTGERCFADQMEKSFYNAYLGALNTQHKVCDYIRQQYVEKTQVQGLVDAFLPFDSYSPLIPGKRGVMVGGLQLMKGNSYYGCCTCIGAAGVGIMAKTMLREVPDGLRMEFYEAGTYRVAYNDKTVTIHVDTAYPADGTIRLSLEGAEGLKLYLRLPGWCAGATADKPCSVKNGYAVFENQTHITLTLPMPVRAEVPQFWEEDVIWTNRQNAPAGWRSTGPQQVFRDPADGHYIAFTRGPLTLCADSALGRPADAPVDPYLPPRETLELPGDSCLVRCTVEGRSGPINLIDYGSAGHDWDSLIAAWLPMK